MKKQKYLQAWYWPLTGIICLLSLLSCTAHRSNVISVRTSTALNSPNNPPYAKKKRQQPFDKTDFREDLPYHQRLGTDPVTVPKHKPSYSYSQDAKGYFNGIKIKSSYESAGRRLLLHVKTPGDVFLHEKNIETDHAQLIQVKAVGDHRWILVYKSQLKAKRIITALAFCRQQKRGKVILTIAGSGSAPSGKILERESLIMMPPKDGHYPLCTHGSSFNRVEPN